MSIIRNLLNIIVFLCVCLNCGCTEGAKKRGSREVFSHTIQVSSLFPSSSSSSSSSSCLLSSKASNTKSSLHLVHRHGPCSHLTSGKATPSPDHDDILRRDQARVDSIHSMLSKDRVRPSQLTDLPAKQWGKPDSGIYVVKIGIGTTKTRYVTSVRYGQRFDMGPVHALHSSNCYSQDEPLFNPSSSSSFHNVSCSSPVCSLTKPDLDGVCSDSTCGYSLCYGDNSTSKGFIANEKFTLTSSDVFDVNFGCGKNNEGDYSRVAGLLGLGPGKLSFPSQTAKTYKNIFSYCLPSLSSYTGGHLTFGSAGISKSVKFTHSSSLRGNSYYGLDITGITVGDKQLEIASTVFSTSGAIIDSGTVITRLPPEAYAALKRAFKEKMSNYTIMSSVAEDSLLDTCYAITGLKMVTIPKIAFSFRGGTVVELDPKGILYPSDDISKVCLAFARTREDPSTAIFGSVQQQTLQVVYDRIGGRVGFAPNGCS